MGIAVAESVLLLVLFAYSAGFLLSIAIAVKFPREIRTKCKAATITLIIYISPIIWWIYNIDREENIEYKKRHPPALLLFSKQCVTAQEEVYKTIEDVEGILLLNVRKKGDYDFINQYWPDAALPREYFNDDYIRSFLAAENKDTRRQGIYLNIQNTDVRNSQYIKIISSGYSYVDVKEGVDFARYQYKKINDGELLRRHPPNAGLARYAVSFINDTNPNNRIHWIAGTTVAITDTWKQEVIAKKTWYSLAIVRPRKPNSKYYWPVAKNCPEVPNVYSENYPSTRRFVEHVLKPKQEY